MRMTTLLKKLLGIQHLLVTGFTIEDGALVIEVRPSWRTPRCSGCTKPRGGCVATLASGGPGSLTRS